jgi:pimeloyl-ACP methyl ester carboxylesterase
MTRTVVFIHGMWGGPWCWDNYRAMFESEGYRCIVIGLPFHDGLPGEVPDPRLGTMSLLDYAAGIEREIETLGEEPIVVGHSMGGLLAQMIGARGLAAALVLLAPAPPAGQLFLPLSVIRSFWSTLCTWAYWRKPVRQTAAEAVYSMLHLLPVDEQREVCARLVHESGRATFETGLWMFDSRRASHVDPSRMKCPVLVLAGTEDRITPLSGVRRVAKRYGAHATLKVFAGHAHWMVSEPGWQDVARTAIDWLAAQNLGATRRGSWGNPRRLRR